MSETSQAGLTVADWIDLCLKIIRARRANYTDLSLEEMEIFEKTLTRAGAELRQSQPKTTE